MNFLKEKLAQIYGVNVSCPIKFNVQGFQLMSKGFKERDLTQYIGVDIKLLILNCLQRRWEFKQKTWITSYHDFSLLCFYI